MFINGVSLGIGLLFLSLLYLIPSNHKQRIDKQGIDTSAIYKPSTIVGGVIALFCWLASGSALMDQGPIFSRVYIVSIPFVFFLLLPMIYNYQQWLTSYGGKPSSSKNQSNKTQYLHWLPVALASLLSLSLALMPSEDFNNMFFADSAKLSLWASINSAGFTALLVGWTALSFLYLRKIVINTKIYHQRLKTEFANHEGKRLDWLVGFTCLLVFTWFYALVVLGVPSETAPWFISETVVSLMVLMLILMLCIQALNAKPELEHVEPETQEVSEQKYNNSSMDDARLKRISGKIEQKVMQEKSYLNPDIDASTLAGEIGVSVHYLSQVFSQEMQTTFYSYINDARIEAAKVALKVSERNVLEIALSVGFNSRSSFYNAFKKNTGMTPSKYKACAI